TLKLCINFCYDTLMRVGGLRPRVSHLFVAFFVASLCASAALFPANVSAESIHAVPGTVSLVEDSSPQSINVKLGGAPLSGTTVTLTITTPGSSRLLLSTSSLDFTDTNWDTDQSFTVAALHD